MVFEVILMKDTVLDKTITRYRCESPRKLLTKYTAKEWETPILGDVNLKGVIILYGLNLNFYVENKTTGKRSSLFSSFGYWDSSYLEPHSLLYEFYYPILSTLGVEKSCPLELAKLKAQCMFFLNQDSGNYFLESLLNLNFKLGFLKRFRESLLSYSEEDNSLIFFHAKWKEYSFSYEEGTFLSFPREGPLFSRKFFKKNFPQDALEFWFSSYLYGDDALMGFRSEGVECNASAMEPRDLVLKATNLLLTKL